MFKYDSLTRNSVNPLFLKIMFSVFLSIFCISAHAQQFNYTLGTGDSISISVYEESDLSFTIKVGDSGKITYPFIGELQVIGSTVAQLENTISQKLVTGEFLIKPEVTVAIEEYRPFYIDGQVGSPGSYPFEPGLTLRKAITLAGGFTERASRSKISIISNTPATEARDILDTPISPDDIINVEQRFF